MTLIFGIVFFVLAKWGFPMITGSVEKRAQRIGESIKAAKEAEERLRNLAEEQSRMIEETRQEQSRILKEAAASRDNIVEQAKVQAREEASRILDQARTQIAAEKESALRDVRKEVALLSVSVAEKVLKKSQEWGGDTNMMYVVGATQGEMFKDIRKCAPTHFLLVPGVGAQGGSLQEVCKYGMTADCGLLVNSSRGIIYASQGEDFAEVAAQKAHELQQDMAAELERIER